MHGLNAFKLLGETEEGIRALAVFESITFAGAAVPVRFTSDDVVLSRLIIILAG